MYSMLSICTENSLDRVPCRLYFGEHNVPGMLAVLQPLHGMMENGPETLKEISFNHVSIRNSYCPIMTSRKETYVYIITFVP